MSVFIHRNPDELGQTLAREVLAKAAAAREIGRDFLLGCPGGRSLKTTYRAMGELVRDSPRDLSHLVIVMMDEYLVRSGIRFRYCNGDAHYCCRRFAQKEIREVINQGLPPARRIPAGNVLVPPPENPSTYDARLEAAGGIDLFLLASGASDGHVAFNSLGSTLDTGTRVVSLPETIRRDNLATFPAFRSLDEMRRDGVTIGLGTIARLTKEAVLVIHGAHKRAAARRLFATEHFTPDWPASVIFQCSQGSIWLDKSAAQDLKVAA